jgi:bacillolysin
MRSRAVAPIATWGAALALCATTLGVPPAAGGIAHHRADRADRALARLDSETTGSVHVARGASGVARSIGIRGETANPAVTPALGRRTAARAHLRRYGALLGLGDPGTRLTSGRVLRADTGDDVVRFGQRRHGLRVVGGSVVVDLRPDRQLGSVQATISRATVPDATLSRAAAARQALAVAARAPGHPAAATLRVLPRGHWLYDPAVMGVASTGDPRTHPRGVWRFEVVGGQAFRHLVLVDDRTGSILQDVDEIEGVNRVVCDDQNFYSVDSPCTQDFARTETSPASSVPDVNDAFDLAGMVSDFYQQIGGIDLTAMLGIKLADGTKALGSTVRFCDPQVQQCPLPNAFWNGTQMFYGEGYASADDVVGHEMTHGVISHTDDLLYWGQSGAINESLADTMGEIMDHRHVDAGDSPTSWTIGEDLPDGPLRSLADPPAYHQPDSTTSPLYYGGLGDNEGVHVDSGVGNKTFFLISQGGSFGGQTVTGIDDATLTKTAYLYLWVMEHLGSGSDFADLAATLEQGCSDLAAQGTAGFTVADCASVHAATLGTGLRTTPPAAPQSADAPESCPTGDLHLLFDSESGRPARKFDAGKTWRRAPGHGTPANAVSGHTSWYSSDPEEPTISSLTLRRSVPLPTNQPSFLWFHHWWVLDFIGHHGFDGGTVSVTDASTRGGPHNAAGLPWVNGPVHRIHSRYGNPAGNQHAFVRDSHGWIASRANLTRYAGHAVKPVFTMNTDKSISYPGWFLDDIRIYTCGSAVFPRIAPRISGPATVGQRLTVDPGRWSLAGSFRYQWRSQGRRIAGATLASYRAHASDVGHRLTVRVTEVVPGQSPVSTVSPATGRVAAHH